MTARIDHLVIAAASLKQGAAWCEATLGVAPGPGGEHPLMGTHNRLLRIATVDHPRVYLEIIAVQPGRTPQRPHRWFDLDDETVRDTLARQRSAPAALRGQRAGPAIEALAALRACGPRRRRGDRRLAHDAARPAAVADRHPRRRPAPVRRRAARR